VWAEKSFDGVIPDDIAVEKQQVLAKRLAHLREKLGHLAVEAAEVEIGIERVTDLLSCEGAPLGPGVRSHLGLEDGGRPIGFGSQ
jgi:hypothetical protein